LARDSYAQNPAHATVNSLVLLSLINIAQVGRRTIQRSERLGNEIVRAPTPRSSRLI